MLPEVPLWPVWPEVAEEPALLLLAVELLVSLGVVPYDEVLPALFEGCCALLSLGTALFEVCEFDAVAVPAVLPCTPAVEPVPSIEPDCVVPLVAPVSFDA